MERKTTKQIMKRVQDNRDNGREAYAGLTSSEIGEYSRVLMFGENDEAFPGTEEWSRVCN